MRKIKFLLTFLGVFMLWSCSNEAEPELVVSTMDESEVEEINQTGIPVGIVDLSVSDAALVAQIFMDMDKSTRSENSKTVKSVVPILDKEGNPAIYAVNFEDGYLLVSATKLLPPILGEIDHGTYDPRYTDKTGEEIMIAEYIETIEYKRANCNINENEYRTNWYPYIESASPKSDIKTRSMDDDEYWDALDSWYYSYDTSDRDKCRIFKFYGSNNTELLSEEDWNYVYESYLYDQDLWWNTDYKWENTAYIVMEKNENSYYVGPLLNTLWSQKEPYNTTNSERLGCVTIATAQIMRFFEYPSTFNWSKMPNSYATKELTDFLAQLRSELHGKDGRATINDAKRVLKDYGYKVREIKHCASELINQIGRNKKPVYARGQEHWYSIEGHAWVIDGVQYSHSGVTYKLYYLDPDYYPNFVYRVEELPFQGVGSEVCQFHMNWGQRNGAYNGWYFENQDPIMGEYNLSSSRKELIINL